MSFLKLLLLLTQANCHRVNYVVEGLLQDSLSSDFPVYHDLFRVPPLGHGLIHVQLQLLKKQLI